MKFHEIYKFKKYIISFITTKENVYKIPTQFNIKLIPG